MSKSLKVLILEDYEADALLIVKELEKAGFQIEWERVESKKTYEKALKNIPDLILADYSLPQYNALSALTYLNSQNLDIPFIIVTGSISEETAVKCIKEGAADYLIKDRLARLGNAVAQALEEKRLREGKRSTERALEESETKYRNLFEESGDPIFMTSVDGEILEFNQAMEHLLGYTKEEILEKNARDFYSNPKDRRALINTVTKEGLAHNVEVTFTNKDGSEVNTLLTARPIYNDAGEIVGLHGILRDITERKRGQRELETIVAVNAALRTAPDRSSMLPVILDLIQDIAQAKGVLLAFQNPASMEISVEAGAGVWERYETDDTLPEEKISDKVFESGDFFISEHIQDEKEIQNSAFFEGLTSAACFPLAARETSIGILWIGSDSSFTDEEVNLIRVVSNIAANAIHRTTLHENNLRALQESRAIAEIGRKLNEDLKLEVIFQMIVDAAVSIISNSTRAVIHLFNEQNQLLHPVAIGYAKGKSVPKIKFPKIEVRPNGDFNFDLLNQGSTQLPRMSSGQGIAGRVIEDGIVISVKDTLEDDRYLQTDQKSDIRSMIVVPILNAGRRLGTLSVLSDRPFTPADNDLLKNLCVQTATAIENAKLLEAERLQRELAEAQAEIMAMINKSLELESVLDLILENTLRVFSFKAANIVLIEEDKLRVARHMGYDVPDETMIRYNMPITDLNLDLLVGNVILKGEKMVISDTRTDPRWNPELSFDWVRASAGIPLKVGDAIIGALNVDCEKLGDMTKETIERLEAFANHAATAVHNARIYSDLEDALGTEQSTRMQLIRADKLAGMGRMVASVAHELNNPLQTIKNCLFLIEQSLKEPDDAELLELAMSEVERLSEIVNRLRDVYRPKSDEKIEPAAIAPLLADVAMLLETHLRRNKVSWVKEPGDHDFSIVDGYPDKLKQVFLNLSLNAIEAMQPKGGPLTIKTLLSEDEHMVGIAFSDTGPGISEEVMDLIFDPFYTTKEAGMGLGLSICYDIAENHNGHIIVNNNPDEGATFTVWLPLSETKEEFFLGE